MNSGLLRAVSSLNSLSSSCNSKSLLTISCAHSTVLLRSLQFESILDSWLVLHDLHSAYPYP